MREWRGSSRVTQHCPILVFNVLSEGRYRVMSWKENPFCLWILMPHKYAKLGVHLALVVFAEWPEMTVEPAALHHAERDRFLCHPEEKTGLSLATAVRLVWLHLCFCINHLLSCPLSALQCLLSHNRFIYCSSTIYIHSPCQKMVHQNLGVTPVVISNLEDVAVQKRSIA